MGYDPWRSPHGATFHPEIARRIQKFIESDIKHSRGEFAGNTFKLSPWQKWINGHLFSWKKANGTRRYRKVFIYIPRKNGKTFFGASIGIILFVSDREPGAEIYCCAADSDQAALIYNEASNMVRQSSKLSKRIKILPGYKVMKDNKTMSYWKTLSNEAMTKHGLNPHGFFIDEVHAQHNSNLIEVMETGTGSRRQPLGIYMTTADVLGDSPCNRMLDYARKVRDGIIDDPEFLPIIYEAVNGVDDWMDESVWARVNPNLGVSLKWDYMRSQFKKAREEPSFENTFKRLHLNMQTEQERRWLKIEDWDLSGQRIEKESLKGMKCFAAIDLSSVSDITACGLFFPNECAFLCWFWVPEKTAKKRIEYERWAAEGHIEIVKGKTVDYEAIRAKLLELKGEYKIMGVAYDPWNASQLATRLADVDGFEMFEFRQGFKSMNEPSKATEKMVIEHTIVHFGNPVLRWMASNAQVQEDPAGSIKPIKPSKDSPLKIDGIVTLVMGIGMSIAQKEEGESFLKIDDQDSYDKLMKEVYGSTGR